MGWFHTMTTAAVANYEAAISPDLEDADARNGYEDLGRTPLRWGGTGAVRLDLEGPATLDAYRAVYRADGCCHPTEGHRLVSTRRPGFTVNIGMNKTVGLLDVVDRPDDVHAILDAETQATMGWLDTWFQERGGNRGKAHIRTPTGGLSYAVTRTATSRALDPCPQDHLLVANVVAMFDDKGGFKGLDSAALRDHVEAATMVGRHAAAAQAIELGYTIEPDPGPSGRRRSWRIAGIPHRACTVLSKRSHQIANQLAGRGNRNGSYSARTAAAHATRGQRRWVGAAEMRPHWRDELAAIDLPVDALRARLDHPSQRATRPPRRLTSDRLDWIIAELLAPDSPLDRQAAFTRSRLIAELAPRLYGYELDALDHAVDRILTPDHVVPLEPLPGAREPAYGLPYRYRDLPSPAQ